MEKTSMKDMKLTSPCNVRMIDSALARVVISWLGES